MEIGIKTSPQHTTWADMLSVWQEADRIERFASAWNFDHFYPINSPDPTGPCMEAWTTLSALAQATSRLRIGCMVSGVVYRHPAVMAAMISSLDIISAGRLEVGLGAGWHIDECEAYGIELGTLTERFDRFDEALQVIISLLANEHTTFEGRYFTVRDALNNPKGPQRPHPPICIGGGGVKRTLPLVARYAQHWNCPSMEIDEYLRLKALLDAECQSIGRDPGEIMTSQHLVVAPDPDLGAIAAQAAAQREAGVDLSILYLAPPHRPDILGPLAEALDGL